LPALVSRAPILSYAVLAVCGLSVIAAFVSAALPAARFIGGCFLIHMGVGIVWPSLKRAIIGSARRRARLEPRFGLIGEIDQSVKWSASTTPIPTADENPTAVAACMETFFLTLTNPLTILSFKSALAAFDATGCNWRALNMVSGVFAGSAAWWLLLSFSASRFRQTIKPGFVAGINYASALIVCGFGLWCLVKH